MGLTVKGQRADNEQIQHMKTIIAVGRKMGAPRQVIQAALMTATQESVLRNMTGGDRDSAGLFQQRPSQGWGSYDKVRTPTYAARQFYKRAIPAYKKGTKDMTVLSQSVQRSAYPEAYRQWQNEAAKNLKQLGMNVPLGTNKGNKRNKGGQQQGPTIETNTGPAPDRKQMLANTFLRRLGQSPKEQRPMWQDIADTFNEYKSAKAAHDAAGAAQSFDQDAMDTNQPSKRRGKDPGLPKNGKLKLAPHGGWGGAEGPIKSLYGYASQGVKGVNISSEKRDNKNPASGNRSDHHIGNKNAYALDIAVPGRQTPSTQLDTIASRLVRTLSKLDPNAKEVKGWGSKGGSVRYTVNGVRYQVIYRSNVGGNHYNHIHIGARKD